MNAFAALMVVIALNGGDEIFITPSNRVDPQIQRIDPNVERSSMPGVWRVDAHSCSLTLREDGSAHANASCPRAWRRLRTWSVGPPPHGAGTLQLRDSTGAQIWSGMHLGEHVFRGRDRQRHSVTLRRTSD